MPSPAFWWRFGCLSAASAVGLGAFGAHALKYVMKSKFNFVFTKKSFFASHQLLTGVILRRSSGLDPYYLKIWETATLYQFVHAMGLLFISQRNSIRSSHVLDWAAISFASGTALFSGSLYLLTLTQKKWLGAITPIGGACPLPFPPF